MRARTAEPAAKDGSINLVVLRGRLTRPPEQRVLPSGDSLVAYEVTTRVSEGRAASAPVTWLSPPSSALELDSGDEVVVIGHVHRRFFRAGGSTQSRTEVVARDVIPVRQRARVARALARTAGTLGPPAGRP